VTYVGVALPQETCWRCGHVCGLHDNGDGACLAYHRGNLGSTPPCDCAAFAPILDAVDDP
jgi:hypothetical protein